MSVSCQTGGCLLKSETFVKRVFKLRHDLWFTPFIRFRCQRRRMRPRVMKEWHAGAINIDTRVDRFYWARILNNTPYIHTCRAVSTLCFYSAPVVHYSWRRPSSLLTFPEPLLDKCIRRPLNFYPFAIVVLPPTESTHKQASKSTVVFFYSTQGTPSFLCRIFCPLPISPLENRLRAADDESLFLRLHVFSKSSWMRLRAMHGRWGYFFVTLIELTEPEYF